ncbi:hypothetical protein RSal33209_3318 [Renibacterium salmoninarum ATCC 33209]|uniref:Uncharacterized protein n=1 Tax=Renibacterium salmoninarum (strain ATCC 33209 / DSM 20767 / JCM 11484 / NBRC 15589 / NCIMB 2235) TaxID=288705 RepID=A9WV09_RENSM|nr:hypothetical protein RSal33209_3318 [Renibacterium salmoninarum ATCC 33209]
MARPPSNQLLGDRAELLKKCFNVRFDTMLALSPILC